MKCLGCGSNLTIDDEKCPFCGIDNPFAVKHRKEMRHFKKEFNKTKQEVMQKSSRVNYWAVKITLIAVLVAMNLGILFLITHMYDFYHFFKEREIESEYVMHKQKLDELEENRDYIALDSYWNDYSIYYCDSFDEYDTVVQLCSNYKFIYKYTMDIVFKDDEMEYFSVDDRLSYIAEQVEYIYKFSKKQEYSDEDKYKPQHQKCMDDLVKDMESLLQTYFHLTDEEIASFEELSKARRQILLEEGIAEYEQTE